MNQLKIDYVPIEQLKPFEGNPRKNDESVDSVVKSIEAFGYTNPILARRANNEVIAGHTRLKALKKLGAKQAPVIFLDLDETDARVYAVFDNKSVELAEWDFPKLADLLVEFDQLNVDLDLTGFSTEEIEKIAPATFGPPERDDDDVIPESPPPVCKTGDLWILGQHRLLCGDCTIQANVERLMAGEKADMVFTDPPYAVNYGADQELLNKKSGGKFRLTCRPIVGDNLTTEECAKKIWSPSFKNLYEFSKDECSFYMTMCQGGDQMMMMMSQKWQIKHELIWVKSSPVFSMGRLDYDYKHEPILFGWKKKHKFYGQGQYKNSIWEIPKPNKSDLHPTMKPVELIINALLNSSLKGNVILDLFLGSGTTLIACEKLNRRCYGMEIEPKYCDVIIKRWEDYTGKKAKLDGNSPDITAS